MRVTVGRPALGLGEGELDADGEALADGDALADGLRLVEALGLMDALPLGDWDADGLRLWLALGLALADGDADVDGLPTFSKPKLPAASALGFFTLLVVACGLTRYQAIVTPLLPC